jgi:hypothetical protein
MGLSDCVVAGAWRRVVQIADEDDDALKVPDAGEDEESAQEDDTPRAQVRSRRAIAVPCAEREGLQVKTAVPEEDPFAVRPSRARGDTALYRERC